MNVIFGIVIILILLSLGVIFYAIFTPPKVNLPVYNNNVLDLIKTQQSWGYYQNSKLLNPYVFKITGNGLMQVSYYDTLGGYLNGIVNFNASYSVIDVNNVQITPTSLISSATNRWPNGKIWKLTYDNSTTLLLNDGQNNFMLSIY